MQPKKSTLFLCGLIVLTAYSLPASALQSVCDMSRQNISVANVNAGEVDEYRTKLANECRLQQRYEELQGKASSFSIRLEKISIFQALRYIDHYYYARGQSENTPVEVILQLSDADEKKPLADLSDLVWRNWSLGIHQIDSVVNDINNGTPLDMNYLKKVHIGFYNQNEAGERGDVTEPGKIKALNLSLISWAVAPDQSAPTGETVRQINQTFFDMGLQPSSAMTGLPDDLNQILKYEDLKLYPAHPHANLAHLHNMTEFLTNMLSQAREQRPMIWKNHLYTPGQLAFFIQQYIVMIHAFYDGNGRTSRFWQDTILALFHMPPASTADLQIDDMLTVPSAYYQKGMSTSFAHLDEVDRCFNEVYPAFTTGVLKKRKPDVNQLDPNSLPYSCRLVRDYRNEPVIR